VARVCAAGEGEGACAYALIVFEHALQTVVCAVCRVPSACCVPCPCAVAAVVPHTQTLSQLGDYLGERHWMYSAALCSLAALHEARGEYEQVGGDAGGGGDRTVRQGVAHACSSVCMMMEM
jgi:hypothetical protein